METSLKAPLPATYLETLKKLLGKAYWVGLLILAGYFVYILFGNWSGKEMLQAIAYWLPAIGMLSVISGQLDLLGSIQRRELVNIKARLYDFIHWFMLIGMNIGAWMIGGVTIGWFILKIILLAVIAWQIGIGLKTRWKLSLSERVAGAIAAFVAISLGLTSGYIRALDISDFGWGWGIELVTAVIATMIVFYWISLDIKVISKKASGYPRSFFLKGIFSNFLVLIFWVSIMSQEGMGSLHWWGRNAALSFNVLIGNLLYLAYYCLYEFHRKRQ